MLYLESYPLTHSYDVDERGLSGVLQTHQSELHLLLPEQALDPIDYSAYEPQHLVSLTLRRYVSFVRLDYL